MNTMILSVGTEILLGDTQDTNSTYLAGRCKELGFNLYKITTVGDNEERLAKELRRGLEDFDLIITTGGLGPTEDDMTKEVAAEVLGQKLVVREEAKKDLEEAFENGSKGYNKNMKQAKFPENAVILKNDYGTAPGALMGKDGKYILVLPGPPRENQPMFENYALPVLEKFSDSAFYSVRLKVEGIGEWEMADTVREQLLSYTNPTVAPYSGRQGRFLKITAKADTKEEAKKMTEPVKEEMYEIFGDDIYGEDSDTLEGVIYKMLEERGETVMTAESITGGMIASTLINVPGMSNHLTESLVVYSDEAKMKYLDIPESIIKKHTAVSKVTLIGMLDGLEKNYKKDLSICSTGYAGPGENAGLVFVGAKYKGNTHIKEMHIKGQRNTVRKRARTAALDVARRLMLKYK